MSRLIHLNGPPGVGKSTLARRYADDHAGVLVLEIDQMGTMVAGWQEQTFETSLRMRGAALAAATAYLADGGDVVIPQLVAAATELARFEAAATDAGASYLHVVLTARPDEVVDRFRSRGDEHPWANIVTDIVDASGGDAAIRDWVRRFDDVGGLRIDTSDPESTYRALLVALGENV
jgi:predicted kinase